MTNQELAELLNISEAEAAEIRAKGKRDAEAEAKLVALGVEHGWTGPSTELASSASCLTV
jgi:hypothetical protein